jgi:hypothetical protein
MHSLQAGKLLSTVLAPDTGGVVLPAACLELCPRLQGTALADHLSEELQKPFQITATPTPQVRIVQHAKANAASVLLLLLLHALLL